MQIVKQPGVEAAVRKQRRKAKKICEPFPSLQRFLADHFPDEWEQIQRCSRYSRYYLAEDGERIKVNPITCHQVPLCIGCSRRAAARRTHAYLDKFALATPEGEKHRFMHIVQVAEYHKDNGHPEGWGVEASEDPREFAKAVWEMLSEVFGPDIGAVFSYQDFGERAFNMRRPHYDLTLNGWAHPEDGSVKLQRPELRQGGKARIDRIMQGKAARFRIDANVRPYDFHVSSIITGIPAYFKILKYQLRELVDLRKLEYKPSERAVYWHDYKSAKRTRMTVGQFLDGLEEYEKRLGRWGNYQARFLHTARGHMADSKLNKVAKRIGGERIPHGKNCPCSKCGEWARIEINEIERMMAQPKGQDYVAAV